MTRPSPRRRRTAWAVALLLVVLAAAANCASGSQQGSASLPGCADLLLIGIRGSGESSTLDHGLGATLADLYRRLASDHPTLDVAAYGLPYAARTTSTDTVAEASRRLSTMVRQRHHQCPNEHAILAGFSLGAEILGDTLQDPSISAGQPPFGAATVLADPRFNPADTATAGGTFEPWYHGDRPRPPYARQLTSQVRSYCRDHDSICQSNDPKADKAEHGRYAPEQTCQALAFIERAIRPPAARPQWSVRGPEPAPRASGSTGSGTPGSGCPGSPVGHLRVD